MNELTLQRLEWPQLLDKLENYAQTIEAKEHCRELNRELSLEEIESRWAKVLPLKQLVLQSYRPPIGELQPYAQMFRALRVSQVLGGLDIRAVFDLLLSVRQVFQFATDFAEKCPTLKPYRSRIYPQPIIVRMIEKAVGPDGFILDDASPELKRVRNSKVTVRQRIEARIRQLIHSKEIETYVQDDFFTVRSERYVVPIKLDGRGRVKGTILDTSQSGQTLYIELHEIVPMNDELFELELAEKIEVMRITKELSTTIGKEVDTIEQSYVAMVELDELSAEASLAAELKAERVHLTDVEKGDLSLDLINARHPLIKTSDRVVVANNIQLRAGEQCLVISGPNAGGKTVILKTVGLLHMMARSGLLVPADSGSVMPVAKKIHIEMGDAQNLSANLSTFSGHIWGLKPILNEAQAGDIVLLDELAAGTDPDTGACIAQAILENLVQRKCLVFVTTHFDRLKALPTTDKRIRNGSMEFSLQKMQATYRLIMDIPGKSFGIEVAEQMGLNKNIIERAKSLRGSATNDLEFTLREMMRAKEEANVEKERLESERIKAEEAEQRWNLERDALEQLRDDASGKLRAKYDAEFGEIRQELESTIKKLRAALIEAQKKGAQFSDEIMSKDSEVMAQDLMAKAQGKLSELGAQQSNLPGEPAQIDNLKPGMKVYVLAFKQDGIVQSISGNAIEVQIGLISTRVPLTDLRIVPEEKPKKSGKSPGPAKTAKDSSGEIPFVPQSSSNSLDLRGKQVDEALDLAWRFIDAAVLRGESAVIIIHGHGTDRLKVALRKALTDNQSYHVRFRPGENGEGGDGATVVALV